MLTLVNSKKQKIIVNPHDIEITSNDYSRVWVMVENKVFTEFFSTDEESFNAAKTSANNLFQDIVTALRIGKDSVIDTVAYGVNNLVG